MRRLMVISDCFVRAEEVSNAVKRLAAIDHLHSVQTSRVFYDLMSMVSRELNGVIICGMIVDCDGRHVLPVEELDHLAELNLQIPLIAAYNIRHNNCLITHGATHRLDVSAVDSIAEGILSLLPVMA